VDLLRSISAATAAKLKPESANSRRRSSSSCDQKTPLILYVQPHFDRLRRLAPKTHGEASEEYKPASYRLTRFDRAPLLFREEGRPTRQARNRSSFWGAPRLPAVFSHPASSSSALLEPAALVSGFTALVATVMDGTRTQAALRVGSARQQSYYIDENKKI
jgi:hypothetical protein